jgi:ribosome maturation protein SDO1
MKKGSVVTAALQLPHNLTTLQARSGSKLPVTRTKSSNGEVERKPIRITALPASIPLTTTRRETDLDNVLQIPAVFLNVSKGQTAPNQDLAKSFGPKTPLNDIILEILNKGELQVGEKERHAELDRIHHEVIDIVSGKLVNPKTKRVYTTGMIEKALAELSTQAGAAHSHPDKDKKGETAATKGDAEDAEPDGSVKGKEKSAPLWTGVTATRSAKSQALDAMKALIAHQPIPVARARMRLRVTCPNSIIKQAVKPAPKGTTGSKRADGDEQEEKAAKGTVKDRILSYVEQVESQDVLGENWEVVGFVEPGAFKGLGEFIGGETKGRGRLEVLDMAVMHEGD